VACGRHRGTGLAGEYTVGHKLAQLIAEDFFGDLAEFLVQLGEAPRAEGEMPEDLNLPFAGKDVDSRLNGTAVVIFHACNLSMA
jgi:hypothetical protein